MSCTAASNTFSRLAGRAGGLTRLAGQGAFYAGLAAGVVGTLGTQQFLKTARQRRIGSAQTLIPRLGARQNPRPIPVLKDDQSGAPEKPQPIPIVTPDKAGTRAKPRRIPALEGDKPRPIPGLAVAPPPPLTETKLKPEAIQVRSGSGQVITAPDSYRVVRPDGSDTGLALTPTLKANGEAEANSWGITHSASGSLVSGPYPDLKQAQTLATQLSGLRWASLRVPSEDVARAREIISVFQRGEG